MALDSAYFDSIQLNLEHRKYYNADHVNKVLWAIRREALSLTEENRQLQKRLSDQEAASKNVGDVLIIARETAERIVAEAQEKADRILADAASEAEDILLQAEAPSVLQEDLHRKSRQLEQMISRVEGIYATIRQQYEDMLEATNRDWQDFLCALPDDLVDTLSPVSPEEEPKPLEEEDPEPELEPLEESEAVSDSIPADLTSRIRSIADLML